MKFCTPRMNAANTPMDFPAKQHVDLIRYLPLVCLSHIVLPSYLAYFARSLRGFTSAIRRSISKREGRLIPQFPSVSAFVAIV